MRVLVYADLGRSDTTTPPDAPLPLRRLGWEHIQRVPAGCDGNISAAACRLGMHRRILQRNLDKHPCRNRWRAEPCDNLPHRRVNNFGYPVVVKGCSAEAVQPDDRMRPSVSGRCKQGAKVLGKVSLDLLRWARRTARCKQGAAPTRAYRKWQFTIAGAIGCLVACTCAHAHAIAGQRLFPSTLNFDDPGIGAELPLVFSHIRGDGVEQNDLDLSVTKPITPNFSLTAETDYLGETGGGLPAVHGWDNLTVGAVWQVYRDARTESIGSFSISRSFVHTGSRAVRDRFSVWSPEFDFGQGFGRAHANWLRPFAVTGTLSVDLPNDPDEPRMLNWGLSLQYSIPYLQDFVKYAGIKAPFNHMIPIIELPMQTCLDRGCHGQTTGYVAPGVIWVGHYVQWGVELLAPINHRTGNSIGVMFGFDFYLDDLAPHGFGAPLFR